MDGPAFRKPFVFPQIKDRVNKFLWLELILQPKEAQAKQEMPTYLFKKGQKSNNKKMFCFLFAGLEISKKNIII